MVYALMTRAGLVTQLTRVRGEQRLVIGESMGRISMAFNVLAVTMPEMMVVLLVRR